MMDDERWIVSFYGWVYYSPHAVSLQIAILAAGEATPVQIMHVSMFSCYVDLKKLSTCNLILVWVLIVTGSVLVN